LAIDAKRQGLNLSELASHFRLYNYFIKSGAAEDKIESFVARVHSTDIPPKKVIELVNQLYDVSQEQSIPVHEVPKYIEKKLDEKKKIEEELREADTLPQNKNVRLQAIDEHIKLK
jgi:hypothetical protein